MNGKKLDEKLRQEFEKIKALPAEEQEKCLWKFYQSGEDKCETCGGFDFICGAYTPVNKQLKRYESKKED